MALRATSGPTLVSRSAAPGAPVTVTAKVENTGAAEERVTLTAAGLPDGASIVFDPPAAVVPAKSRKTLTFTWTAALPPGKPALTYRGKLVLAQTDTGRLVGQSDLDLYVG